MILIHFCACTPSTSEPAQSSHQTTINENQTTSAIPDSVLNFIPPSPFSLEVDLPPTLTLDDNAHLSISHLINNLDPASDYRPFFILRVDQNKNFSEHADWDFGDMSGRYAEALLLARKMTGTDIGIKQELALRQSLIDTIGPDGLSYRHKKPDAVCFHTADQASVFLFLLELYESTTDSTVKIYIENLINGFSRHAISTANDGLRFEDALYPKNYKPEQADPNYNWDNIQFFARFLQPLAHYLNLTDSPAGEKLFHGLSQYIQHESGVFQQEDSTFNGQVHSRASAMTGILIRAQARNDKANRWWVQSYFDFLINRSSQFGWVPEVINFGLGMRDFHTQHSEICAVVDVINLATLLAHDDPDQWELVDRYLRNQLTQTQFTNPSWLPQDSSKIFNDRAFGSFSGYAKPNYWGNETMNCCSSSGLKGLYLVWKRMVEKKGDITYIHLSLNHLTPEVLITSWRPYRGEVSITARKKGKFALRIPPWVKIAELKVNGKPFEGKWISGQYILLEANQAGQIWLVSYPLIQKTKNFELGSQLYKTQWRGNTVVSISPQGKTRPLYSADRFPKQIPPLIRTTLREAN